MSARPIVEENEKRLKLIAFFASQIAWEMEDNLTRLLSMTPANATTKNRRETALIEKILGRNSRPFRNTNTQPITSTEREIIDYIEGATFFNLDQALRPPAAISEALQTDLKNYRRHRRLQTNNKIGEIGIPTLAGLIAAAGIALLVLGIVCPAAIPLFLGIGLGVTMGMIGWIVTPFTAFTTSPHFKNKARDHKEAADGLTHAPKMLREQKEIATTTRKARGNTDRFFDRRLHHKSESVLAVIRKKPPQQTDQPPEPPSIKRGLSFSSVESTPLLEEGLELSFYG